MDSFMKEYEHLQIQLKEIKSATNNFDKNKVIGEGGFGKVYAGELCHSNSETKSLVALKCLDRKHGQGDPQFWKEIMMLSRYRHENLISLLGYCIEDGERILIYEHASRGSLERYLKDANLTWTDRIKICLDAAKGLSFLHDPNERQQRVLHCDIKSANILLDDNLNAKVSDFGLSKMGSAGPQYSVIITDAVGTRGYCDPLYMETYQLTKESDVYSFGVVLFEVLCGKQCVEASNGQVYVPYWKKAYEDKKLLEGNVLEDLKKQMAPTSFEMFTDIAYQCLKKLREERPAMSLVVKNLEKTLKVQEPYDLIWKIPKEYQEVVNAAVDRLVYRSLEELKELLTKGVLLNDGKMWLSMNDEEERCVLISIEECLIQDDPNKLKYFSKYSWHNNNCLLMKDSRFPTGYYKADKMNFKLRIRAPLFLSPDVTYELNLVFHYWDSEREKIKEQHVGIMYKFKGETKISILHFEDRKEYTRLVAGLYQFNSTEECISDFEILLEDCGLSGDLYIEGIEFQPLKNVVVANHEIVRGVASPLFHGFIEEPEVFFSQGVLLRKGNMWFSINDKEEHCLMLSIEECLIRDDPNINYTDAYSSEKHSRFVAGCYKAYDMTFKIRIVFPLFLSPHVTYGVNLVFQHINIKKRAESFPIMYKLQGETKISWVNAVDMREDGWREVVLYHFANEGDTSILDLEIISEDSGISGYFYIEGIEFQPLGSVEYPVVAVEYEEILKATATPLFYRSTEELKSLLTRGIFLHGGKTLFRLNEKGEHIERRFIEACLNPDDIAVIYPDYCVDSRFPWERDYKYKDKFKARARGQYLTLQISYTVNLFMYQKEHQVNLYNLLRYKIDGEDETKVFIIYPSIHMRKDKSFMVPFYHFTSKNKTADLQFEFEHREATLIVMGFEFQPSKEKVELPVFDDYQHIVDAASQSLSYKSLDDLKRILSIGVHLNGYKTWFSLNEKGEHCHMISMKDCLISDEGFTYHYKSDCRSRFPMGLYQTNNKGFKTHVKTQLLSPLITYTVNLVFYSVGGEEVYVDLKYRLRGETKTSTVYLAKRTDDDPLYMAELYQFTSDGRIVNLEIIFENSGTNIDGVEGILFQPLEKVEDQLLEDDKVEDIETISDSDTYWEQKIPNDYEEILKLSKDSLEWKTKKELYSILCKGFLLDNGQQWFFIDKNGKKCHMQSAREATVIECDGNINWESSNESRSGEMLVITAGGTFEISAKIASTKLASPKTKYDVYLVYKLPHDQSTFEAPMEMLKEANVQPDTQDPECVWINSGYIHLASPPHTPVIGPNLDEKSYNPRNRCKQRFIPRKRSDGWMEVEIWDFETKTTPKIKYLNHRFCYRGEKNLKGLTIQGIEIRPI